MKRPLSFAIFIVLLWTAPAYACESCLTTVIGRRDVAHDQARRKPFFADFLFEQQNWNTLDAAEAHTLHHQGHHVHNKTHEELYHFQAGANPHERVTVSVDLPYVVREEIEVHSHSRLGQAQSSEGWGDLHLLGVWRAVQNGPDYLGPAAGVKFPTGATKELNPVGGRYSPELQPGTGSYDFPLGVVYRAARGPWTFTGNAIYTVKTEGDQNYEFGDAFTTSLVSELTLNPDSRELRTSAGLDLNYQHERKHQDEGVELADSGGDLLLAGPSLTITVNEHSLLYGTFLMPVAQERGGHHQELDFVWTAGARILW